MAISLLPTRRLQFSSQGTILSRLDSSKAIHTSQEKFDTLVSSFLSGVTDPYALTALMVGGMASRFARIGSLTAGAPWVQSFPQFSMFLRTASAGIGLVSEAAVFEGVHRGLKIGFGGADDALLRWGGVNGFKNGFLYSLVSFGALKGAGAFGQEQNLFVQHLFQDTAMVASHNVLGALRLAPRPQESLADQFSQAEVMNLQIQFGMGLVHGLFPQLASYERSQNLFVQSKEGDFSSHISKMLRPPSPNFEAATVGPGGRFFSESIKSPQINAPHLMEMDAKSSEDSGKENITLQLAMTITEIKKMDQKEQTEALVNLIDKTDVHTFGKLIPILEKEIHESEALAQAISQCAIYLGDPSLKEAPALLEKLVSLSERVENPLWRSYALRYIAEYMAYAGLIMDSKNLYRKAIQTAKMIESKTEDDPSQSVALQHIALGMADRDNPFYHKQADVHEELILAAQKIGEENTRGDTLCNLALHLKSLGLEKVAFQLFLDGLSAYEIKIGIAQSPKALIDVMENLERNYSYLNEAQLTHWVTNSIFGKRLPAKLILTAEKLKDEPSYPKLISGIANMLVLTNQRGSLDPKILPKLKAALPRINSDPFALLSVGKALAWTGEGSLAIDIMEQGVKAAEKYDKTNKKASALYQIAIQFGEMGAKERAIEILEKAATLAESHSINLLLKIGAQFAKYDQFNRGAQIFREVMESVKLNGNSSFNFEPFIERWVQLKQDFSDIWKDLMDGKNNVPKIIVDAFQELNLLNAIFDD